MAEFINTIINGDCREVLKKLATDSIAGCITDPPYNYEFIGHKWDHEETERRLSRVQEGSTLVKNIPYGSGLAGGVRNERWYQRIRENISEYQDWCLEWATEVYRVCKPGAFVAAFNSTRTSAHVQVALERAGFYSRDCLVYRRPSGIPKGLNIKAKFEKQGVENAQDWANWHSCLRNEWEAIVIVQKPLEDNYMKTVLKHGVGLFNAEGPKGSFQSNILEGFSKDKAEKDIVSHCTTKPLSLMKKLVTMLVPIQPDNVVLDPFAGTGTTLLAAKSVGLSYVGIEIVPDYIDQAHLRLQDAAPLHSDKARSTTHAKNGSTRTVSLFPEEMI